MTLEIKTSTKPKIDATAGRYIAPKIQETDFDDVYSLDKIKKDLGLIDKCKSQFEEKKRKDNAEDMEWGIAYGMAGYMDWFQDYAQEPYTDVADIDGAPATVFMASEYDDITARTDVIMVLNNIYVRGSVVSLDATSACDPEVIGEKFYSSSKNRDLPKGFEELTYVDAKEEAGVKGGVPAAPHFVVGVNADSMSMLRHMTLHGKVSHEKDQLEREVALKIINEMRAQARSIEVIAKQNGSEQLLSIISPLAKYLSIAQVKAQRVYVQAGGNLDGLLLDDTYRLIMNKSVVMAPPPPKIYAGDLLSSVVNLPPGKVT